MAKKRKKEKPGPIEKLAADMFDVKADKEFGCLGVPQIFERAQAADQAIALAAQLARGAKNYVQGSHNPNAGKWVFISKPKLNELKKALRKVGVKI